MKSALAFMILLASTSAQAERTLVTCHDKTSQDSRYFATIGYWEELGALRLRARLDERKPGGVIVKTEFVCEELNIPHPTFPEQSILIRCSDITQRETGRYYLSVLEENDNIFGILSLGWPNGRPRWRSEVECETFSQLPTDL